MPRLIVFNHVSLDGFFTDAHGDMSWAHRPDPEWNEFAAGNASGDSRLLFGRVTYQLMAGYWPTEAARKNAPEVAEAMGQRPKVVFSTTLESVVGNYRLLSDGLGDEVRRLKEEPGQDIGIGGAGLAGACMQLGLVDEWRMFVSPILLGGGTPFFPKMERDLDLELVETRTFAASRVVYLRYIAAPG